MLLDENIKKQLTEYLALLEGDILIKVSAGTDDVSKQMVALVSELSELSAKIRFETAALPRTPSFSVNRPGEDTGITFAGVPLGHEFSSLILALLQVSGRAPKIENELIEQIKQLKGPYNFVTYINLSCHNCPEVVQALNVMSLLNTNITNTMVDGAVFLNEVEEKEILAVPTVYLNGELFSSGRMTVEDILAKFDIAPDNTVYNEKAPFDVLVIGGSPAGTAAAIYAARKGLRTGLAAERLGGQIQDTFGIENFIGTPYTEGPKLAVSFEEHMKAYEIDIMKKQRAREITRGDLWEVHLDNGAVLKSKTLIISTGAHWRNIGIPGENEYKTKGIAYCPHCDGPFFKGKRVAVIGGGNSGVEAAIDLAGMTDHVTVLEASDRLRADAVLQEQLSQLPNVTVLKNVRTEEITGASTVNGLTYLDCSKDEQCHVPLEGVFILIGLLPNTGWTKSVLDLNDRGEIIVDKSGATNAPGIFAAGDCTDQTYKQIIISMGSGATAALSAFNYLIRN